MDGVTGLRASARRFFISQVTRRDLADRDIDDIGDKALTYAEVNALATGDPLILKKATVDDEVALLNRLEPAYRDDQTRLRRTFEAASCGPAG